MRDLSNFHFCASELMHHIGCDMPAPTVDQDVIRLAIDPRFTVHLGSIDDDHWLIQADLGMVAPDTHATLLARALRANQLAVAPWLPAMALDDDNRLVCWLRLPVRGNKLPALVAAFNAVVASAEHLLEEPGVPATAIRPLSYPASSL